MAITRQELEIYLNDYMKVDEFKDYGPLGLVVEGKDSIRSGISGVSFTAELAAIAAARKVDFILVHHPHGFWKGQPRQVRGGLKQKLEILLREGISLFSYHLPLDAHPEVGNNALLCKKLGFEKVSGFYPNGKHHIGLVAESKEGIPARKFFQKCEEVIGPLKQVFASGPDTIRRVGIISGGAPDHVDELIGKIDCYVTGESREHTQAWMQEEGIHFVAGGHHQTERFGVQMLGAHIESKFGIKMDFVDIPNPV